MDTPVMWQYRFCYGDNTVTPGWGAWETVVARNPQTVEDVVSDLQHYIDQGYQYELRALYAGPVKRKHHDK